MKLVPPYDHVMENSRYVWRNWQPRTSRQEQVANAVYAYMIWFEPRAQVVIINGVEYKSSGNWRISYSLQLPGLPHLRIDNVFVTPANIDKWLKGEFTNG